MTVTPRILLFNSHPGCATLAQVVMMLKSSDRVAHDIDLLQQQPQQPAATPPTQGAVPAVLVLRRWYPALRPEREFRCFVRQGQLLGVSQRDISQHFPQLTAPDAESGSDSGSEEEGVPPRAGHDNAASARTDGVGSSGAAEGSSNAHLRRIRRAIKDFHSTHIGHRFGLMQCEWWCTLVCN